MKKKKKTTTTIIDRSRKIFRRNARTWEIVTHALRWEHKSSDFNECIGKDAVWAAYQGEIIAFYFRKIWPTFKKNKRLLSHKYANI